METSISQVRNYSISSVLLPDLKYFLFGKWPFFEILKLHLWGKNYCHCSTMGFPVPSLSLPHCPICSIDFPDISASPRQTDTGIIKRLHQGLMLFENFSAFIILAMGMLETMCKWHLVFGSTLVFLLTASTISDLISARHRAQSTFSFLKALANLSGALKEVCLCAVMECQSYCTLA